MDEQLTGLSKFFARARARNEPLVMATVLATAGSTYAKAGARILIGSDGAASGMLSGGCLEADLHERAARVLARDRAERVFFDSRTSDDPIWGIGMGCEGAMDVWLQPSMPPDYPAVSYLHDCLMREAPGAIATVVGGAATETELGKHAFAGASPTDPLTAELAAAAGSATCAELGRILFDGRGIEFFVAPLALPTSLLICGAGPDAVPVHAFSAELGWRVTIYDHRPAFASSTLFPQAVRVLCGRPQDAAERLATARFDAAVVMSHQLAADAEYLRWLAREPPRYIGLLGPEARRKRLLLELGDALTGIADRLHGPVGLDIGATAPAGIALSIVAHIQAVLAGRAGGPFR